MRRVRGITFLELLLSLMLSVFVASSLVFALSSALKAGPNVQKSADDYQQNVVIEDRLRTILSHAWLNTSATDQTTYFTTNPQQPGTSNTNTTATTGSTTTGSIQNSQNASGNGEPGGGADMLVFTALGLPTSSAALYNDDDFQTNNNNHRPTGGAIEYGLSLQSVGNSQGQKGLFLREQRPADTDPTQGGLESLLIPDVDTLSFEFWDGTQWETSWDTPNMTPKRLPAAIRITYSIGTSGQHSFIVTVPNSDVTPANPVSSSGASGSTSGGGA